MPTNKPAMNNPRIRRPKENVNEISAKRVAWQLDELPTELPTELRRDTARLDHENYLAGLSIDALSLVLFPGKGEEKHAAGNADERKQAIDYLCSREPDYQTVRKEYEAAQRDVDEIRARQENLRLIARLMISQ